MFVLLCIKIQLHDPSCAATVTQRSIWALNICSTRRLMHLSIPLRILWYLDNVKFNFLLTTASLFCHLERRFCSASLKPEPRDLRAIKEVSRFVWVRSKDNLKLLGPHWLSSYSWYWRDRLRPGLQNRPPLGMTDNIEMWHCPGIYEPMPSLFCHLIALKVF